MTSVWASVTSYFNPRPPCGGRRINRVGGACFRDFNPRPPCGGRPCAPGLFQKFENISIHGPRVGADARRTCSMCGYPQFQSTAPVWGPTTALKASQERVENFNPRPPCGGRPISFCRSCLLSPNFNPRPPCGGRQAGFVASVKPMGFQSTAPVWGPTVVVSVGA